METVDEEIEEYSWKEVVLRHQIPEEAHRPELERELPRDILVAVDHGPNSRHAFHWALNHLCRHSDTIHLILAVSSVHNEVVYDKSQELMEKLAVVALRTAMVRTVARIVEGEPGKVICREADKLRPVAVVMGTRGRGIIKSVLRGSVGQYCLHNCKSAPIIIVPGKDAGESSVI